MIGPTAWVQRHCRRAWIASFMLGIVGCGKQGDKREFLGLPDSNPVDNSIARVVVTPGIGTVQQSEPISFGVFARRSTGDSVGVDVAWSATGGTVSQSGVFSATGTGSYWVVARSTARPDKADSAAVFVVGPANPVTSLSVSPKDLSVRVGQTRQFTAVARFLDGSQAALPIYWSASGGTIDGTGLFSAVQPGSFLVIAVAATGLADTARVTIRQDAVLKTLAIEPSEVDVTEGKDEQFSVRAEWSDGSTAAPAVDFRTDGGTIDHTGRFTALSKAGDYTVVANARGTDNLATARVRIRTRSVVGLSVSPSAAKMSRGAWQLFAASARYTDGSVKLASPSWTATGGSIDVNGVYHAGQAAGSFVVIATLSGSMADTAEVVIDTPVATLTSLVLSPSSATLASGATQGFSVTGSWSDGTTTAPAVTWSATGGTISPAGLYTAGTTPGSYRVIATHEGGTRADTSAVTITAPVVTAVTVSPASVTVRTGISVQFSASTTMSDGTSAPSGGASASASASTVTWSAAGGIVSQAGLYTAGTATGTYQVIARAASGAAGTSLVTVAPQPPVLQQIVVTPGSATLQSAQGQQFVASGVWTNGGSGAPVVTWSATGGTVSATGFYTAGSTAGSFRVIATEQGGVLADTSVVTISAPGPVLTGIVLTPSSATVQAGSSQQFTVVGIWTNGGSGMPAVVYSATGGTVSSSGLFTSGSTAGVYRVISTQQGGTLADTSAVTITSIPPQLVGIMVGPKGVTVATGQSQQYSDTGVWTNGGTGAPAVNWTATGGTITAAGQFIAGSTAGGYRVIATQSGGALADTASVTVAAVPPTLTTLRIQPKTVSIQTGLQQQFTASATWSDGGTTVPALTWSSTGGTITTSGLFAAPATAGTYRVVVASVGSPKADTATVSVVAPVVTQVVMTPASVSVPTAGTQQFQITATWSDGVSRPAAVGYSATGGTISSGGLYTAGGAPGSFRVVAAASTGPSDTSATTVTASAITLTGLQISPKNVSVNTGALQLFGATALWSDGTTTLPPLTWTASGGTISAPGQFAAGTVTGTFWVIVAGGGKADTAAVLIVTAPPPGPFPAPTLGTKDFESGLWSTAPAFTNGGGAAPGFNGSIGAGHRLVNDPASANGGAWSYQYDYVPSASEVGANAEAFRTSSTGANADEMYWRYDFKLTGTPITSQLKWTRFRGVNNDLGGLYGTGGGGTTHVAWAFGAEGAPDANFNFAIGISWGALPASLTAAGYTKYGENLLNDGKWHRMLVHLQRNNGMTNPRVRFWFDGIPIRQSPSSVMSAHGSQTTTTAAWTPGNSNDPDYGANAPSWLTVGNRVNTVRIFTVDMNVTLNAGNTGAGRINFDNMVWSTKAIQP